MGKETARQNRQNNWQADQNELDRDFQREMLNTSTQLDFENWLKQFNLQNAQWATQLNMQADKEFESWMKQQQYLSPEQEVNRLRSAGLNPSIMMGNGASLNPVSSAPSLSPSVSAPKGSSMSTGSPSGHPATGLPDQFQSFASIMDAVSKFASDGLGAAKTFSMLDAEVRKTLSDAKLNEAQEVYQDLANNVFRMYGDKRAAADYMKIINEAFVLSMQGRHEEANALLTKQLYETEKHRTYKTRTEADMALQVISSQIEKNDAEAESAREVAKTQGSVRELNSANARQARSSAAWLDTQSENMEYINNILRNDPSARLALKREIIAKADILEQNGEINKETARKIRAQANQAVYDAQHYEANYWKNFITDVVSAAGDAAGEFTRFKLGSRYVDLKENEQNSVVETGEATFDKNGNPTGYTKRKTQHRPKSGKSGFGF